MKKVLKYVIIILIIILVIFAINLARNYFILKDIYEKNENYLENCNNFYYSEDRTLSDGITTKLEIWYKDNISLIKNYQDEELISIIWQNWETNEILITPEKESEGAPTTPFLNEKETMEEILLFNKRVSFDEVFKANILRIIGKEGNNYIINDDIYQKKVNKDTGMVEEFTTALKQSRFWVEKDKIELNKVTDDDIIRPE